MNKHRLQITLSSVLAAITVFALLLGSATCLLRPRPDWLYSGQLHNMLNKADHIVVRDGGHDWPNAVDNYPVLFEIQDAQEIDQVLKQIAFDRNQYATVCACQGYPVIDWYNGSTRIAITSLQHGGAIRWDGFAGDASLTHESGEWIVQWLVSNGVPKSGLQ